MLDGRAIWYLIPALLIGGAVAAGISYWVANAYIVSQRTGDPLQTQAVSSRCRTSDGSKAASVGGAFLRSPRKGTGVFTQYSNLLVYEALPYASLVDSRGGYYVCISY
jgi:hypothetical protein